MNFELCSSKSNLYNGFMELLYLPVQIYFVKSIDKRILYLLYYYSQDSNELVDRVNQFSSPVESFKSNVTDVGADLIDLRDRLDDLRNSSMRTKDMVRA